MQAYKKKHLAENPLWDDVLREGDRICLSQLGVKIFGTEKHGVIPIRRWGKLIPVKWDNESEINRYTEEYITKTI